MGALLEWWPERLDDRCQDTLTVRQDFVVPEPKNAPALSPELTIAQVMVTGLRMLAAIRFDDQAGFKASEVDDVGRDGELASKSPAKPILAEFFP